MIKCEFCGSTKSYFDGDYMRCSDCSKLLKECRYCEGKLVFKNGMYICNKCESKERFLRRHEKEEFNKDQIYYTECLINHALEEYDKKFKALLLMMVQKGLIKDISELQDVLDSMNVINTLKDDVNKT
jgi:NAD-dependent SIR2 family protein deacetylase